MCEKWKMSLGDKRLHKRAGENTQLSSSFISPHHFRVFGPCMYRYFWDTFSFDLTVYYNSAVFNLANSDGGTIRLSSFFQVLPIPESHSEAIEQIFIGRSQSTMFHNTPWVTAAVWFPHSCDFISWSDFLEGTECGTQSFWSVWFLKHPGVHGCGCVCVHMCNIITLIYGTFAGFKLL